MNLAELPEQRCGLSHERLLEFVRYDPETGIWTRLKSVARASAGDRADILRANGYRVINIDGFRLRAHRVAWFYMTTQWPSDQVDHIDNDPSNNKWPNLRLANNAENRANAKRPKNNTSGFKGVFWSKQS